MVDEEWGGYLEGCVMKGCMTPQGKEDEHVQIPSYIRLLFLECS